LSSRKESNKTKNNFKMQLTTALNNFSNTDKKVVHGMQVFLSKEGWA
jgi:hypothetical protein